MLKRHPVPYHPDPSPRPATAGPTCGHGHLFENVLLPHQLLPFPIGLVDHDVQDVLPVVGDITDKEHQVLQQLDDKPSQRDTRDDKYEALTLRKPEDLLNATPGFQRARQSISVYSHLKRNNRARGGVLV